MGLSVGFPAQHWQRLGLRVDQGRVSPMRVAGRDGHCLSRMNYGNVMLDVPAEIGKSPVAIPTGVLAGIPGFLPSAPEKDYHGFSGWCSIFPLYTQPSTVRVEIFPGAGRPLEVKAFPNRQFVLRLCGGVEEGARLWPGIERGLAMISEGMYADVETVSSVIRHDLASVLTALIGEMSLLAQNHRELKHLAIRSPYNTDELLRALSPAEQRTLTVDEMVTRRLNGLFGLSVGADTLNSELRRIEDIAGTLGTWCPPGGIKKLRQFSRGLQSFALSAAGTFSDLGAMQAIGPMPIKDANEHGGKVVIVDSWLAGCPDGLLNTVVLASPMLLKMVFRELFSNAERAAKIAFGRPGASEQLAVVAETRDGFVAVKVSNLVNDDTMRQGLLDPGQDLLGEVIDPTSLEMKQRLFLPGVTSRPSDEITADRGGIGLSLTYSFVQRMGGQIHADYDPKTNRFNMVLDLPLATPA